MARRIVNIDEMIDLIDNLKGGAFVTICYVNQAKIGKTAQGLDLAQFSDDLDNNRMDGDDEHYQRLKTFASGSADRKNKFPYKGIVKMTTCQFNWQTSDAYSKSYGEYANKRDDILKGYGAEPEHRDSYEDTLSYGKHGIRVGNTDNTNGRLYVHQNGATMRNKKYRYFLVDEQGELTHETSGGAIRSLIKKNKSVDGLGALKKIQASSEVIERYTEQIKDLNFNVLKLMFDRILFIVASIDGEKVFLINSALTKNMGDFDINPKSFIDMANKIYKESYAELKESIIRYNNMINESVRRNNKQVIRLTEQDLHNMIKESVSEVLCNYKKTIRESKFKPIKHSKKITLKNGANVECVRLLSDGYGKFAIGVDDGCYVIYHETDNNIYEMYKSTYIFPELHTELKKLPILPLK